MATNWKQPFAGSDGNEIVTALAYLRILAATGDGFYPVGANGLWHGGIHFDTATDGQLRQSSGVRCIADGEIVAYRIDHTYPELVYEDGSGKIARYSTGFVLVRHKLTLPPAPAAAGAENLQTTPPAEDTLTFFSLVMHLQNLATYETDAQLARPVFWQGSNYVVGSKANDTNATLSPGVTGLNVRDANHAVVGLLPRGTSVSLGAAHPTRTGFFLLSQSTGVAGLPADTNLYVFRAELDASSTPHLAAIDNIHVLATPFPVKAGDVLGHLGEYQTFDTATALPNATTARPLLHLEVFTDDALIAFVTRSKARAATLPASSRNRLLIKPGAKLAMPITDDVSIAATEALTVTVDSPKEGLWAKAQRALPIIVPRSALSDYQAGPPATYSYLGQRVGFTGRFIGATDDLSTIDEAAARQSGFERREILLPQGNAIWVRRTDISLGTGEVRRGWTRFPLQLSSLATAEVSVGRVIKRADLDKYQPSAARAHDDQSVSWWLVSTAGNSEVVTGWVCERDHPNAEWKSQWDWPGFEFVIEASAPADQLSRGIHTQGGAASPAEAQDLKQRAERLNSGALFAKLFDLIDGLDRDGQLSLRELRNALLTPWVADPLSHLIVKYESEWGGTMDKWAELDPLMLEGLPIWQSEKKRIEKLRWWDGVAAVEGFPGSPTVHFFHPLGLVDNFQGGCVCFEDLTNTQLSTMAPGAPQARINTYLPVFNETFRARGMNSCMNRVHFLAQVIHESGDFRYTRELGANLSYDPWRGRGLIQITFQTNYAAYGAFAGVDFTSSDTARARLEQTPHSVGSAFWYWSQFKSLDVFGEADDFIWLTISVNGGLNGYDHRLRVVNAGIETLGIQTCAVKNVNGVYRLEESRAYTSRRGCFAWGLWNDPGSNKSGKTKNVAQALIGYRRYIELWQAEGRPNDGSNSRWYGYGAVANHASARIQALGGS